MDDDTLREAEAAAAAEMTRRYEAHADDDGRVETRTTELGDAPAKAKSPAEWAYQRLVLYIQNFEKQLDSSHEVAMGFTGGEAGVLRIEGMGFFDPDIITFYGSDPDGGKTQLVQHISQLNVMLRALPKQVPEAEPRRIGFKLAQDAEKATEA